MDQKAFNNLSKSNKRHLKNKRKLAFDFVKDYLKNNKKTRRQLTDEDKDLIRKHLTHQGAGMGDLISAAILGPAGYLGKKAIGAAWGATKGVTKFAAKQAYNAAKATAKAGFNVAKEGAKYVGRKTKEGVKNAYEDFTSRKKPNDQVSERVAKKRIRKATDTYIKKGGPKPPDEMFVHNNEAYYAPTYKNRLNNEYAPTYDPSLYIQKRDQIGKTKLALVSTASDDEYEDVDDGTVLPTPKGYGRNKRRRV
jgi:hypothetical protein